MDQSTYHEPVLANEVVDVFEPIEEGTIVDATFGGGGHSLRLRDASPGRRIIGIDRDPEAIARGEELGVEVVPGNFADLAAILDDLGIDQVEGVLFDLGVSSRHLDAPHRGFSYRQAGPLDMRMGPDAPRTAEEVVNTWEADRLADVIRRYGEERFARRIADAIVAARPIRDTAHLAEVVRAAIPAAARRSGPHPATRTFQAIRIAVNEELDALRSGLDAAIERLAAGGRVAVIAYHSLEDRIVKRRLAEGARGCTCPPDLPVCVCGRTPELRLVTRKAIRPTDEEIARNPRARSARLRAAEKVREAA